MRVVVITIAVLYLAGALAEESWNEKGSATKLGSSAPSKIPESMKSQRKQYLVAKLNEVRAKCETPLDPISDLTIHSVAKQIVDGTEYIADVTVDDIRKTVTFTRLLPNNQKPHHFNKDHGAGNIKDLFELKSIHPHPCGEDTAQLTDESYETAAELNAKYKTGLILPEEPLDYAEPVVTAEEMAQLPTNFDWREKIKQDYGEDAKAATVLNQGSCGSCWAFGGATAAGYRTIIASKGQYNVVPSTQVGMSCAKPSPGNPCGGGWFSDFYNAMNNHDVPANWAVDYEAKGGSCQVSSDSIAVKGATSRGVRGVDAMMNELYTNGPFGMAVDAGKPCFQRYKSGVADCAGSSLSHAVVALGWGTENGKAYWLVQNSWGAGWGANGFIKIARGNNALMCEQYGANPNTIAHQTMQCSSSPPCKNGGAFKKDCSCKCLSGYSGAQCDSCQKSCNGAQFTGAAAITGGSCQCTCAAGYATPSNLLGYSDCALKMEVGGSSDSVVKASQGNVPVAFSVVGTPPSDPIQNVKKGDMFVAVAAGSAPWTASGGWNTDIKADVCGAKKWPAEPCGSSTAQLQIMLDGLYDIFYVKYLGVNEFGTDKGYGSDFMRLPQRLCAGAANCDAAPPPPAPPPPPPPAPAPPPPPPPAPPSGGDTCQYAKDGECDEPTYCRAGTDTTDCGGSSGGGGSSDCADTSDRCSSWGSKYCGKANVNGQPFAEYCCATCSGSLAEKGEDAWSEGEITELVTN